MIQSGAFKQRGLATREARSLREQGFNATESLDVQGGRLWKVYVGQYATYDEAVRVLPRVQRVRQASFITP